MARRTDPPSTKKGEAAQQLKAAAAEDQQLLEEIRRGLEDEKKSGWMPLRKVHHRARHGSV